MKRKANLFGALLLMAVSVVSIAPEHSVAAIQAPTGCNSNRLNLSIARNKLTVQQGETLTYTVTASNLSASGQIACDIDNATVTVTLPAFDGTPTGTVVTLGTAFSFPAETPVTTLGTVSYTVNVDARVTDVVAEAHVIGTLHDAPTDHTAEVIKTIGTAIIAPTPAGGSGAATATTASATLPKLPNAGAPRH